MPDTTELRARFQARKKEIEAQLDRARADASAMSDEQAKKLQSQLDDLKQATAEGWENLSQSAIDQLSDLLKK